MFYAVPVGANVGPLAAKREQRQEYSDGEKKDSKMAVISATKAMVWQQKSASAAYVGCELS
jgi:hypothetical protein